MDNLNLNNILGRNEGQNKKGQNTMTKKEYLVLVDLGVVIEAKNEKEAEEIVEERFKFNQEIRENPITTISIHKVEVENK